MPARTPKALSPRVDLIQFLIGFHIEHEDAGPQGKIDFIFSLTDAGIDDFRRIRACLQRAVELTAGDEIHTAPLPDEDPEDRRVGIGLDGKADDVRHLRKGGVEDPKMVPERPVAVEIKGGPRLTGDRLDRDLFAEELVILIFEVIHCSMIPYFSTSVTESFSG